jgi:enoyl-CoA hydratase/carnithine racemase
VGRDFLPDFYCSTGALELAPAADLIVGSESTQFADV